MTCVGYKNGSMAVQDLMNGGEMADEDMREMVDAIQEAYLIAKKNNKKYTPKKYRKDE